MNELTITEVYEKALRELGDLQIDLDGYELDIQNGGFEVWIHGCDCSVRLSEGTQGKIISALVIARLLRLEGGSNG